MATEGRWVARSHPSGCAADSLGAHVHNATQEAASKAETGFAEL